MLKVSTLMFRSNFISMHRFTYSLWHIKATAPCSTDFQRSMLMFRSWAFFLLHNSSSAVRASLIVYLLIFVESFVCNHFQLLYLFLALAPHRNHSDHPPIGILRIDARWNMATGARDRIRSPVQQSNFVPPSPARSDVDSGFRPKQTWRLG